MSDDLVKKLRSQIGDDVQEIYSHEALFCLAADRIAALEAGLRQLADGREPMVHDLHRDRCVHRRSPDEECVWCVRAFARALLDGGKP